MIDLRMSTVRTLFVLLGLHASLANSQEFEFTESLDDPSPGSFDDFGDSVAIHDNRVVVGAPGDNTFGTDVGQAHLFDAETGNLIRTFNDPTVTGGDQFGDSVAIDGDHVVIGACDDDSLGEDVGQAYLFDAESGALLATFNDPTVTTDDDTRGTDVGQASVFQAVNACALTQLIAAQIDSVFAGSTASDVLRIVRSFRDSQLAKSPHGERLIALYYEHGPALSRLLKNDPELALDVPTHVVALLPAFEGQNDAVEIDATLYESGLHVLSRVSSASAPRLRLALREVRRFVESRVTRRGRTIVLRAVSLQPSFSPILGGERADGG